MRDAYLQHRANAVEDGVGSKDPIKDDFEEIDTENKQ